MKPSAFYYLTSQGWFLLLAPQCPRLSEEAAPWGRRVENELARALRTLAGGRRVSGGAAAAPPWPTLRSPSPPLPLSLPRWAGMPCPWSQEGRAVPPPPARPQGTPPPVSTVCTQLPSGLATGQSTGQSTVPPPATPPTPPVPDMAGHGPAPELADCALHRECR